MSQTSSGGGAGANVYPLHHQNLGKNWINACHSTRSGPIANLNNALLALRNDPEFQGRFRYDQMLSTVVELGNPVEDINVFRVHEWLQAHGLRRIGLETVREAVTIAGHDSPFHPVRDWLNGLAWDGVPRLGDWLHTYVGADENEYYRQIGSNFLKAMVARIMQPGCKADYMLVLEGPQRRLKSSICQALAGEYFSDQLPDIGGDHVRVSMHLRGKWLIEVSELSSFTKADAAKLKSFLSSPVEKFTPKHARNEVIEPRQCLFIGTTNDAAYLKDPTGGSRFWPVKCGNIDLDALKADREQLFAEAVAEYHTSQKWWPDPDFEEKSIKPMQDLRFDADAWEEPILTYLASKTQTTLLDTALDALGFTKSQFRRPEQLRVAAIMRQAGWWDRKSTGGSRIWLPPP